VRFRVGNSDWVELQDARTDGDSVLIGTRKALAGELIVPLTNEVFVQVRRFNPAATLTMVGLTPVVLVGVLVFLTWDYVYTLDPEP
jgi:hypothetical protein